MRTFICFLLIAVVGFALLADAGNSSAPMIYWDANATAMETASATNGGGTGSWDDATGDWWAGGAADGAWTSNGVAYFGGKPGKVTLNASESVSGLVFAAPGYCLGNIDGTSALTLMGHDPFIKVPGGMTTIGCDLVCGDDGAELTVTGAGQLVLTEAITFAGGITIKNITLALGKGGSISHAASITLDGAVWDVSRYSPYCVAATTAFRARAAGIEGNIRIDGPVTLDYAPGGSAGDSNHPALCVAQGSLTLGHSGLIVNNTTGVALGLGVYSLIQVPGGDILRSAGSLVVTGSGIAPGTSASVSVSGHSLNLVVGPLEIFAPAISSVAWAGNSLVLSGVNGPAGGTFRVLTSTNLSAPFSNWTVIATDVFSQAGTFRVTNSDSISPSYFIIRVP